MISKDEIKNLANAIGPTPNVVEKEYVLGWLLAGFNANTLFSDAWAFNGGTCLKKCYFETYRFSENLDFTLTDEAHLDEALPLEQFASISQWVYGACGVEIPTDRLKLNVYTKPRGKLSREGRAYYQSYFAFGKKSLPKIKFDLTATDCFNATPRIAA